MRIDAPAIHHAHDATPNKASQIAVLVTGRTRLRGSRGDRLDIVPGAGRQDVRPGRRMIEAGRHGRTIGRRGIIALQKNDLLQHRSMVAHPRADEGFNPVFHSLNLGLPRP